jgi:hypothetical protein
MYEGYGFVADEAHLRNRFLGGGLSLFGPFSLNLRLA